MEIGNEFGCSLFLAHLLIVIAIWAKPEAICSIVPKSMCVLFSRTHTHTKTDRQCTLSTLRITKASDSGECVHLVVLVHCNCTGESDENYASYVHIRSGK